MNRSAGTILVLLLALVLGGTCAPSRAASDPQSGADKPSITAMLAQSAYQWNHGNLEAFMRGYDDSPSTVYISSKGVIHGYAAIRAHYAAHYGKSGMGVLTFSDLSVRSLGSGYAVIVAHWHLAMSGGAHPTGPFSLLLHRTANGWRIIEDCTP
jgi:hypothetical protein